MKIYCPVSFPFGYDNINSFEVKVSLNQIVGNLSKHKDENLHLKIDIQKDSNRLFWVSYTNPLKPVTRKTDLHSAILEHYAMGHGSFIYDHIVEIEIKEDIGRIANDYSCPDDIKREIYYNILVFLQGFLLIFGAVRIWPIMLIDSNNIELNNKLSNLADPFNEWFFSKSKIEFTCYSSNYNNQLTSFVKIWKHKFDFNQIYEYLNKSNLIDTTVYDYCRLLSKLIRLKPSEDMSLIIGLLTAFIENILVIKSENRYKFAIKICNLLHCQALFKSLTKIYDKRSDFFHSANYQTVKDNEEILVIYFLLIVCSRLILHKKNHAIDSDSFNFIN